MINSISYISIHDYSITEMPATIPWTICSTRLDISKNMLFTRHLINARSDANRTMRAHFPLFVRSLWFHKGYNIKGTSPFKYRNIYFPPYICLNTSKGYNMKRTSPFQKIMNPLIGSFLQVYIWAYCLHCVDLATFFLTPNSSFVRLWMKIQVGTLFTWFIKKHIFISL